MNATSILRSIGCSLFLLGAAPVFAQFSVCLPDDLANRSVSMSFHGKYYEASANGNGMYTLQLPEKLDRGYAVISGPLGKVTVYIDSHKSQAIVWERKDQYRFQGHNQAINEYLNDGFAYRLPLNYLDSDTAFIRQWSLQYEALLKHLEKQRLPQSFADDERIRLYYAVCNSLLAYPVHHALAGKIKDYAPSALYYQTLDKAMKENPKGNGCWEYRQAFRDWIEQKITHEQPCSTSLDKLERALDYVRHHITDSLLASYLVDNYLTWHVRHYGTDGTEAHLAYYDEAVRDPQTRQEFHTLYDQYSQLAKGKPAPDFCLPNAAGDSICLKSLRGNYVYIDVWATWCMPCCREFPYLKQLESQLKDRNILFIGISIDSNPDAWKQKIAKEQLSGIQLHAGNSGKFFQEYKIGRIPRFIWIDPQGNILNANMTRPSDPATLQELQRISSRK